MVVDDVCDVLRQLLPCCLALLGPDVLFVNDHAHSACTTQQHTMRQIVSTL
jgi:hypothetical protein